MPKSDDNVNHSGIRPEQPAEDQILDLVHTVMHQYRSQQYQVLRDGPHDITHMESKVLGFFGHRPGSTQSELAQHSGRDKAQLARLIKGLRERGLLAGVASARDGRSVVLSLTANGQQVLQTLEQQTLRLNDKAVAGFDAAERRQLLALMGRVRRNLVGG